jgi:hypothetical protein
VVLLDLEARDPKRWHGVGERADHSTPRIARQRRPGYSAIARIATLTTCSIHCGSLRPIEVVVDRGAHHAFEGRARDRGALHDRRVGLAAGREHTGDRELRAA